MTFIKTVPGYFLIGLVLLGAQGFAVVAPPSPTVGPESCPPPIHKANMPPAKDGLLGSGRSLELMRSVAKLQIEGSRCTGAFISDQAHILTASHCLDKCAFNKDGKFKAPKDQIGCTALINGEPTEVMVISMNDCPISARHQAQANLKAGFPVSKWTEIERFCAAGSNQDLALIVPRDGKNLADKLDIGCAHISETPPREGHRQITLGYAQQTARDKRKPHLDSDGQSMRFSDGVVMKQRHCEIKHQIGKQTVTEKVPFPAAYNEILDKYTQSGLDIERGSSGGPSFNEDNEIDGLAAFILNPHDQYFHCEGATFFQPVNHWRSYLKRMNKESFVGPAIDAIKCEERSIKKRLQPNKRI